MIGPVGRRDRQRSTNTAERMNQKLKRRTRVVRIFPHKAVRVQLAHSLEIELNKA
jgi:transposase-like protein